MGVNTKQSEMRLQNLLSERETTTALHEELLSRIEQNEDKLPDEIQKHQLLMYRERCVLLDEEIASLSEALKADRDAEEQAKSVRRALAYSADGIEVSEEGVVYRTMAHFARDVILTRESEACAKIQTQFGDLAGIEAAKERLNLMKRVPANTLSSDVEGLQPVQHIAQIMQVIDRSRPIVASARQADLERGQLSYPFVEQRPVVAAQTSEKTEAGNQKMIISMETAQATVYLGGGDLSWQAINWSTPNALAVWFDLAAEDYALKTEADAAQTLQHSAFTYNIGSPIGGTPDFGDFVAAVAAGAGAVYDNSGRIADTVYIAPDRFFYLAGLTTDVVSPFLTFTLNLQDGGGNQASMRVVRSRGMDSGVMVVGDSAGLLVAETPGAPVELRVVEPAIGGVEVGIIGGFEAVVVDPGAFAMLTTAS